MIFQGTATALITPFKGGKVDLEAYDRLLDFQLSSGVNAVVTLGTTGEPATLSEDEKREVIQFTVQKLHGKLPVLVGCGANSTALAISSCQRAERLGADGALVVTPYYNKCSQQGLYEHYMAIANSASLPIVCYNVPSRTGVNMQPSTFGRLARDAANIVAIKEASGNMEQIEQCLLCADGNAAVYSGDDALTVPIMSMGGKGVISVASNILPKTMTRLTRLCLDGDYSSASRLQLDLLPVVKALFSDVNPIPVKYAASLLNFGDGTLRLPLTPLSPDLSASLSSTLSAFLSTHPDP